MKCLDTTFIIDFLRNDEGAISRAALIEETEGLVITSINIFEVLVGIEAMREGKERRKDKIEQFISRVEVLPFDVESARRASRVADELIKNGKTINVEDSLVAGAMISSGCNVIITRDAEHFSRISEIEVEGY